MYSANESIRTKTWRLGSQDVCLRAATEPGTPVMSIPPSLASAWMMNAFNARNVQSILEQTSAATMLRTMPRDPSLATQLLCDAAKRAIARGEIVALRREAPASRYGGDGGAARYPSGSESKKAAHTPPPPQKKPEKTWVEFRLVDDEGRPVRGARYRLQITDNSVREGKLDDNGSVRVNNIDSGPCHITFLDYDQTEWKRKG